jgi:hypothetical protein
MLALSGSSSSRDSIADRLISYSVEFVSIISPVSLAEHENSARYLNNAVQKCEICEK